MASGRHVVLAAGRRWRGLTLVEVVVVVALVASLLAWAVPALLQHLQRVKIKEVISDLHTIQDSIYAFEQEMDGLPDSLDELPFRMSLIDGWGNPYEYLTPAAVDWAGKRRKDRFIVPLNTDYDLYSVGPDGDSRPPLTANASRDDIVRASNGAFIGPASEF